MSQTYTRVDQYGNETIGQAAKFNDIAQPVEVVTLDVIPETKILSNLSFTTSNVVNIGNDAVTEDFYLTSVSIAPFVSSYTLTFWITVGNFVIGTQSKPVVMSNAIYTRDFKEPHLPLITGGMSIMVSGSSSTAQSVTVIVEGYRVVRYG